MTKLALVAVSLAAFLGTTQVYAQSSGQPGQCKAEIDKTESLLTTIKDDPEKQAVVKEMTMAKDMAAKNDEQGCMTHMTNVRAQLLDMQKRGQSTE